jgi:serine/threonine-protein kinase
MFPASPRAAVLFGVSSLFIDVGVAALWGTLPDAFGTFAGTYHGFLTGALLSVAVAYLGHRLGQTELTSANLGSYALVEKLGEGGMGEVWRADHALLKRGAAVKLIHPKRLRDPEARAAYRARFELEVQSASRLRSPYTVEIFDYGEREDGVLWFAMELVDGVDMVRLVFDKQPLQTERVVHLLRQVCCSLQEAHEHGLVHRDIKPNNVMVGRTGAEYDFVTVLDFGLVKTVRGREDQSLMRQGATPGTPGFMAPEQISTPTKVDARADVYGVGCLAYFLVSGRLVFEDDDWDRVKMAHVEDPVVPPSERTELHVPKEMDAVIVKCLEKDPADRYQTAEELAEALGTIPVPAPWTRARAKNAWANHPFRDEDWSLAD